MRRITSLLAAAFGLAVILAGNVSASDMTDSLKKGTPELKSAGPLAFGPEGILFVGDTASAAIFAIGTGDVKGDSKADVKVEKINEKIGSMLGAASTDITINDLKVNPASGNLYLSITRGKGSSAMPVIVKLDRAGKLTALELKDVPFSSVKLDNASSSKRTESITGLNYVKGKLYVAGLSNEEFASKLRSIPFPFKDADKGASVEIYHGAHGRIETNSPVRTFTVYDIAGETNLLASYTCTPLVKFPVDSLKPGEKVHGTTVAELGNMNVPLDMIVYTKEGKDYLLMANTRHGVIKVKLEGIDKAKAISSKISGTAGLTYDKIPEMKDVVQLDKLDADRAVYLTKAGTLDTVPLP
jgi:hypothetical protein